MDVLCLLIVVTCGCCLEVTFNYFIYLSIYLIYLSIFCLYFFVFIFICTFFFAFNAELPGPPSNLVISKISSRSATLKFRAGDDGKTTISKWIVEGQASNISVLLYLIIIRLPSRWPEAVHPHSAP